jgi:hypothetical protein
MCNVCEVCAMDARRALISSCSMFRSSRRERDKNLNTYPRTNSFVRAYLEGTRLLCTTVSCVGIRWFLARARTSRPRNETKSTSNYELWFADPRDRYTTLLLRRSETALHRTSLRACRLRLASPPGLGPASKSCGAERPWSGFGPLAHLYPGIGCTAPPSAAMCAANAFASSAPRSDRGAP